jgi:predicted nucleotidyltransferase component of viral defense system
MDNAVLDMLEGYNCKTRDDYQNALKEIMQEIALLGLWRAKFFEHALFYGGTALRILYNLPRFSEDLDFSLLESNENFDLTSYHKAIKTELESFGFTVAIGPIEKNVESQIESAFINASTKIHLMRIKAPEEISSKVQVNQILKIKFEIDTDPPGDFSIQMKNLLRPVPFQVKTMPMSDLFAGKCHACLVRKWKNRVKGRDFYDFLWYLRRKTPLNLQHLEARLIQSGNWRDGEKLTLEKLKELFRQKFSTLDIEKAKQDVYAFLSERERAGLEVWSSEFFISSLDELESMR